MPSHSFSGTLVQAPPPGVYDRRGRWTTSSTPRGIKIVRVVLILALVPLSFYLAPRVFNLVVTPDRLDQTIVHAASYNPDLHSLVEREYVTLGSLDKLDSVATSLKKVRGTVAEVSGELVTLVDQITQDVQGVLNLSDAEVRQLLARLARLQSGLDGLHGPVGGAAEAVAENRAQIAQIIREGRSTGSDVHDARGSADNSADNVDGGN